jgi:hypothetical protein
MIVIHPRNSDVVWVAAQGPLWTPAASGGCTRPTTAARPGIRVLAAGEWTRASTRCMDPRDPDRAVRHHTSAIPHRRGADQRRPRERHPQVGPTAARPGAAGPTASRRDNGQDRPRHLAAQIPTCVRGHRLAHRKGGFWRSADAAPAGRSSPTTVSGGTGPHYYQEIFASPPRLRPRLPDGRATPGVRRRRQDLRRLAKEDKHSDNHAMAFDPTTPTTCWRHRRRHLRELRPRRRPGATSPTCR